MTKATPPPDETSGDKDDTVGPVPSNMQLGGTLPIRPNRYVPTSIVKGVSLVMNLTVRTGGCCLIDGPVGVGKTTAVVEAAREMNVEAVYVNMFGTDTHRSQMDAIWRAMTGTPGVGTASQIRDNILDSLNRAQITLLIDDAHRVGVRGLATLLSVWNSIHAARGTGTPIVFCGNNLVRHLSQTLPELLSRSGTRYSAAPLTGNVLVETVLAMEPRIAGTHPDVIKGIDSYHFRGEIRRWAQFFDLLAIHRGTGTDPMPLTDDETKALLGVIPRGGAQ